MPELPEVEIVRQSLDKKIRQKKVKKVIIRNRNLRIKIPINFKKKLENKKVSKVSRFSKYLIINFYEGDYCIIHLGMSGTIHLIRDNFKNSLTNLSFYNSPMLPKKHNHIEIIFDEFRIVYNDPRRFGFFQMIKNNFDLQKRFLHLGPEPFDKKFNLSFFKKFIAKKNRKIKDLIIDQKFVSGIGNIYANEILFLSKINPNKKIRLLKEDQCNRIISGSKTVLQNAIKDGGSSIRDFKSIDGNKGGFQDKFKVYGREGLNCKRKGCEGIIIKRMISNRSTFFCNICQK